jgi:hypothetical protein
LLRLASLGWFERVETKPEKCHDSMLQASSFACG